MPQPSTQLNVIETEPTTYHASPERLELTVLEPVAKKLKEDSLIRSLVQGYPEAMAILNEHRQIVACNDGLLTALGLADSRDVLGRRIGEVFSCEYSTRMPGGCGTAEPCQMCGAVNAMLECNERREVAKAECRITTVTPDGPGALDLEVVATPFDLGDQKLMVFAARDISAHKRREVLEKLFFHDTLNVAGGIEGLAELLEQADDAQERQEYPKRMSVMSHQLTEQIRGQRDLAAAERGELKPSWTRMSVTDVFENLRSTYEGHPVARDRTLVLGVPSPADLDLQSDPVLLGRVLGNLIKNALEASDIGQVVSVECNLLDDQQLRFTVHNTNVMPYKTQLQMFQRSFSTKGGTGRGLGTFSVKLLTTRYLGGEIDFFSRDEHGTSFFVTLPRCQTKDGAEPEVTDKPVDDLAHIDGVRILLAEDGEDNQRLICHVLTKAGADVTGVVNGKLALDAAVEAHEAGRPFDVILMDMQMPVMDGYEATRELRKRAYSGSIVALTAHTGDAEREECLAAGCDGYVAKPISKPALFRAIADRAGPAATG